jgi:hypothetical protein
MGDRLHRQTCVIVSPWPMPTGPGPGHRPGKARAGRNDACQSKRMVATVERLVQRCRALRETFVDVHRRASDHTCNMDNVVTQHHSACRRPLPVHLAAPHTPGSRAAPRRESRTAPRRESRTAPRRNPRCATGRADRSLAPSNRPRGHLPSRVNNGPNPPPAPVAPRRDQRRRGACPAHGARGVTRPVLGPAAPASRRPGSGQRPGRRAGPQHRRGRELCPATPARPRPAGDRRPRTGSCGPSRTAPGRPQRNPAS